VRSTEDEESTDEKKPLEKTPGEKPIALWATSAPNGAGVLSNGYHFVGVSPPTGVTLSGFWQQCRKSFVGAYPTYKNYRNNPDLLPVATSLLSEAWVVVMLLWEA
jgi:hypothetical protein